VKLLIHMYKLMIDLKITFSKSEVILVNNGDNDLALGNQPLFEQWMFVVEKMYKYNFENSDDIVRWKWSKVGHFTTRFVYDHLLTRSDSRESFKQIWKSKSQIRSKSLCGCWSRMLS